MEKIRNYINGEKRAPANGAYFENIDPAVASPIALVADSDRADVDAAVESAGQAFAGWAQTPASKRAALMLRLADLVERDQEALALLECTDTGKPLSLARSMDIPRAVANLRFYGTAILHDAGESHATDDRTLNYTQRVPAGVAACISPWNLPLYLLTWKMAPAIAAGCTVVAKPSELSPMTASRLTDLISEAGFPPGVVNVIFGTGARAGDPLISHPQVAAISFTGGTKTGQHIAQTTAASFKKISLEMGGKNPNLIFADAPWEEALDAAVQSSFTNQGEICLCGSRILVEENIYERFVDAFIARVRQLKTGDPLEADTKIGALISERHLQKVCDYVALAKTEGGSIEAGGVPYHPDGRCRSGYFMEPTVICNVPIQCRVNQEEIFGPVVTITPFRDEEEGVAFANQTPYGLSATIWTSHLQRAHRVAARIQCGIIWINCWMVRDLRTPFGGMKQSGVGREGGWHALHFFSDLKNVCLRL